jgi:hypothetical protein
VFVKRGLIAAAAFYAFLCLITPAVMAGTDKVLQNQRGDVEYQRGKAAPTPIGASASVSIEDGDYAITGGGSLGALILPDSSQILLGSNTKVQLAFFNQAQVATANFVLYNGKTRFAIRHPQGALANYTFSTATGQIAVRGTDGDIDYTGSSMRVNVYDLTDPTAPVVVSLQNGRTYTLRAGESLFARYVNGVLQVDVEKVTQQAAAVFTDDFGPPPKNGGPTKPAEPKGPAPRKRPPENPVDRFATPLLAFVTLMLAIALLGESFMGRPLYNRFVRLRSQLGFVRMAPYCRRRMAARTTIEPRFIGRVLINPQRTRTGRDGRIRRWGFIQETGKWLRVISNPNGTVTNAFFDRGFKFEDRVRPRN